VSKEALASCERSDSDWSSTYFFGAVGGGGAPQFYKII